MDEGRIREIWTTFTDGEATAADESELLRAFSDNQVLRQLALDDQEMDGLLNGLARIDATAEDFVTAVSGRLTKNPIISVFPQDVPAAPPVVGDPVGPSAPPKIRVVPSTTANAEFLPTSTRNIRRPWRLVAMSAAAALLVVVTCAAIFRIWSPRTNHRLVRDKDTPSREENRSRESVSPSVVERKSLGQPETERIASAGPVFEPPPKRKHPQPPPLHKNQPAVIVQKSPAKREFDKQYAPVAQLGVAHGAVWESPPQQPLGEEPLFLKQGTAKIHMNRGAAVTAWGPTKFVLNSPDRITLGRGRISVEVPPRAVGFTVLTPSSRIVDLGTRFEVSVDENEACSVRVREGVVELQTTPAGGAKSRNWRLHEGQFKHVDADGGSVDWRMELMADPPKSGFLTLNGEYLPIADLKEFEAARRKVLGEFTRTQRSLASQIRRRDTPFRGVMVINHKTIPFDDVRGFLSARDYARQQLPELQRLYRTGRNAGVSAGGETRVQIDLGDGKSMKGSITINGQTIEFGK